MFVALLTCKDAQTPRRLYSPDPGDSEIFLGRAFAWFQKGDFRLLRCSKSRGFAHLLTSALFFRLYSTPCCSSSLFPLHNFTPLLPIWLNLLVNGLVYTSIETEQLKYIICP